MFTLLSRSWNIRIQRTIGKNMDYYGSFVFNEEIHTKEYVANVYSVLKLDAVD